MGGSQITTNNLHIAAREAFLPMPATHSLLKAILLAKMGIPPAEQFQRSLRNCQLHSFVYASVALTNTFIAFGSCLHRAFCCAFRLGIVRQIRSGEKVWAA